MIPATRIRFEVGLLGGLCLALGSVVVGGCDHPSASKPTVLVNGGPTKPSTTLVNAAVVIAPTDPATLAKTVTIYRDAWGTPHIDGPTDESVVFGFAYAQAEDNFWQIEDSYILAMGRYSEVHGPPGLNSDLLNRAFEIVPRSQADFPQLEPEMQRLLTAFAAGLNYYLATHPEVKPRLITKFEPWQVVAFGRHALLELAYRYTRLTNTYLPRMNPNISAALGSNAWAIGPQRTKNGRAMLLVNPHLPWFGLVQFYEAHLRSGQGWDFTGATFIGSPLPSLGHNDACGWTFTVNEADIADAWVETFDDPTNPLHYRYGDGYRMATEWQEKVKVQIGRTFTERAYKFRKTHHGPVVGKQDAQHPITARIARLHDALLLRQSFRLMHCQNVHDFKAGMGTLDFPFMNALYADKHGDIFYVYNGAFPRRDPKFDWSKPVDGSDPATEWNGYHTFDELPQVLNPPSGYLQNCNSSPFTTTGEPYSTAEGNPKLEDFPAYMAEDKRDDKRRAKLSRQILSSMHDLTFDQLKLLAFDTTIYWAQHEFPAYGSALLALEKSDPKLAAKVKPYLDHLLDWDFRGSIESTQASLCVAWYNELYGPDYPGETLKPAFADNLPAQLKALTLAASRLEGLYGTWKVPFGDTHRIQRHPYVADLIKVPFDDDKPSLPCAGTHGPMGVIFTQYYTPTIQLPFIKNVKKHYGVLGATYLGVYEFSDRVQGATLINFGENDNPVSPHYFDQAKLLSERKLKPELFDWKEIESQAKTKYHPGQRVETQKTP